MIRSERGLSARMDRRDALTKSITLLSSINAKLLAKYQAAARFIALIRHPCPSGR